MDRGARRMRRTVGALAGALAAVAIVAPTVAGAQARGVAVDVSSIHVSEPVRKGDRYSLPTVTVRNPGELAGSYRMTVQGIAGGDHEPPADWFTFAPERFVLEPDGQQPVAVTLTVPRGAPDGDYEGLLAAQLSGDTDGARVGAAAAARLRFSVQPLEEGRLWWILVAVLLTALLAVARRLRSRYTVSVQRRR